MPTHSPARDRAIAALEAQARKSVFGSSANDRGVIKDRARAYARAPRSLDAIRLGLFGLSPRRLVEFLEAMRAPPDWRWFGFGGEHPALNVRGALLYARYSRAKARQIARRAA